MSGSQTYGGGNLQFTQTKDGPAGITVSSVSCATAGRQALAALPVGTHTLDGASCTATLAGAGASNYNPVIGGVPNGFSVNPPSVNVTVTGSHAYGTTSAFQQTNDAPAGITVDDAALTCAATTSGASIDSSLAAGSHTIDGTTCSGVALSGPASTNAVVNYVGGSYAVAQPPVTVTVTGSHAYGAPPAFQQTNDAPAGITVDDAAMTCAATTSGASIDSSLAAGSHTIDGTTCSGVALSGPASSNYRLVYVGGSYSVAQAPVTVTVTGSYAYGDTPTFHQTNDAPAGITIDDAALTCTKTTTGANIDSSLPAGSHTIDGASCSGVALSGPGSANHTLHYAGGGVTVAPRSITVHVTGTQPYGASPSFTPDYSSTGWAGSDGPSVVSGALTCSTDAGPTTPAGSSYAISNCSGLSATNYAIDYAYGPFTVTRISLTVAADAKTMTHGDPVPELDVTITGFVNGETLATAGVTGSPACSTTAISTSAGGNYPIECTVGTFRRSTTTSRPPTSCPRR
ncbi:MAG: hypothetical protein M3179_05510 [Actinomycetota bacterium]|nr:hypothetical protein [Actinomycetota bacterium]